MPTYVYKAVTKNGLIVKNRVESASRLNLIKSLKNNNLMPIAIQQVALKSRNTPKRQKRNVTDIQQIMRNVNTTRIGNDARRSFTLKERVSMYFAGSEKITPRDVVVFTQNFYLLKKANFNNIHALSTIIESTDNFSFRGILEDILAGVEARRKYVYNNGILFKCISIHICKYG